MDIFESWLVTKKIAHRGFHNDEIPENTLAAFENAINHNFAIELDLRCLADGTVVVFHDDKLGRMTGIDGYLSNLKISNLKNLKIKGSNQKIPTFKETLDFINGRTPILIEIKNMNKVGFEKEVWRLLENYSGEYAVQSFNPYTLEWFKNNAPHVKRGQLASFFKKSDLNFFKRFALKRLLYNKVSDPNFISYKVEDLPNRYVKKYKNLPLLAWCVRSQMQHDKVKKICDNIIFEGFDPVN